MAPQTKFDTTMAMFRVLSHVTDTMDKLLNVTHFRVSFETLFSIDLADSFHRPIYLLLSTTMSRLLLSIVALSWVYWLRSYECLGFVCV